MTQLLGHEEMLYELDMKMYIINQTLQEIMRDLPYIRYECDLLDHIQVCLNRMHSSIFTPTS